eukprot:4570540-Pyramimonas_sp.AAC.2
MGVEMGATFGAAGRFSSTQRHTARLDVVKKDGDGGTTECAGAPEELEHGGGDGGVHDHEQEQRADVHRGLVLLAKKARMFEACGQ